MGFPEDRVDQDNAGACHLLNHIGRAHLSVAYFEHLAEFNCYNWHTLLILASNASFRARTQAIWGFRTTADPIFRVFVLSKQL